MSYTILALKWRPKSFDEVIGQTNVTESLKNAIAKNKIAVAYLFSGPRGIGKTSTARIFAKALNCIQGPTTNPCQTCSNCVEITEGRSLDVIEIDGASNRGIDEVRALRENVKFPPTKSKFKIYIIDEVHMLTEHAFNALLKTLEEPPPFVKFIFATTHPENVIPTILSRCQHFRFRRVPFVQLTNYLEKMSKEENIHIDKEVLFAISQASDGCVRDALMILEQLSTYAKDKVSLNDIISLLGIIEKKAIFDIVQKVILKDTTGLLELVNRLLDEGKSVDNLLYSLIQYFRNLMIMKAVKAQTELIDLPPEDQKDLFLQAQNFSTEELFSIFNVLVNTWEMTKKISFSRILLEINLLKLAYSKKPIERVHNLSGTEKNTTKSQTISDTKEQIFSQDKDTLSDNPGVLSEKKSVVALEKIKEHWQEVISSLSQVKMLLAQFLKEAEIFKLEGDKLILSFPKNFSLHKETLEKKENLRIVEKVFNQLFDVNLRIEFVLSE
ncbi:MAG: DNA polymerase III subunit gamma/tau, partial [Candidatus Omnitrophica bacterium]|nr:DNA polymerase III subunit gamma/tau [Candidatus Omnitrophota bacterium]